MGADARPLPGPPAGPGDAWLYCAGGHHVPQPLTLDRALAALHRAMEVGLLEEGVAYCTRCAYDVFRS